MDESIVESIFTETDFLDRTVLKLITHNQYEPLMKNHKISDLLDLLWVGKNSYDCDGRVTNFSLLSYLSIAQVRKLKGQDIEIPTLLGTPFKDNIEEQINENFSFQYKFRKKSIAFIFAKELIVTIFICMLLIMVNYTYLTKFSLRNFEQTRNNIQALTELQANETYWSFQNATDLSEDFKLRHFLTLNLTSADDPALHVDVTLIDDRDKLQQHIGREQAALTKHVELNIADYQHMNLYGILISVSMMFYVSTKMIFNIFAQIQMPMDIWSQIDVFCAFAIMTSQCTTINITPEDVLDLERKHFYNMMMLVTIIATWMRLIGFFFVMEEFSKLIMTIVEMLSGATTFLLILSFYLIVMSTIAICLFQESSISYSNTTYAMRTLFDAMLGMYQYQVQTNHAQAHGVFMMIHIYIANIFMLNYLVAILSTVYAQMEEKGDFKFKCYKYKYIARYNIAFADDGGYTELVVHPPPLNLALIFLLPAVFKKDWMKKYSYLFSKINFWFENIFFILDQLLYEMMLVPVIFVKIFGNVVKLAEPLQMIQLLVGWIIGGWIYLIYGVAQDMYYFVNILREYKMDEDQALQDAAEEEKSDKIIIYNEIIDVLRSIYFIFIQAEEQKIKKKTKIKELALDRDG
jgi:hypothetical protein